MRRNLNEWKLRPSLFIGTRSSRTGQTVRWQPLDKGGNCHAIVAEEVLPLLGMRRQYGMVSSVGKYSPRPVETAVACQRHGGIENRLKTCDLLALDQEVAKAYHEIPRNPLLYHEMLLDFA